MAKKKRDQPDVQAGELAGILRGYGLNPRMFDDLINEAVINQWSSAQFAAELYSSDEFAAMFPGIFNKDGSLKVSPSQYLQLAYGMNGYVDIGKQFGVKLGVQKIGELIHSNVSPDEWAFRAMVLQQSRQTEAYRQEFNLAVESSGGQALSKGDWFNFIARKSHARIENLYEAVALRMAPGLELSPEEALAAAKQIGAESPTEKVDINAIIGQVAKYKNVIGPELRAAGISDADLAVLQSGADPRGLGPQLEQILRNREALVGSSLGGSRQTQFARAREGL